MANQKQPLANKSSTPMFCGHCGKHSVFVQRGVGTRDGETVWENSYDAIKSGIDFQTITTWRILECTLCHEPTLAQEVIEYVHDPQQGAEITAAGTTVLYPKAATKAIPADLPPTIAEEYAAAIQVQNISLNACAVLLRRVLEAICNHENAGNGTLEEKVNRLLKSASIPRLLADMAHLGRHIGNVGAHAGKDATEEDITVMLNFIDVMFLYLYTTPTKILAFKEKLKTTP